MFKEVGGHAFKVNDVSHIGPILEGTYGFSGYYAKWWEFEIEIQTNYGHKTIKPSFKTEEEAKAARDGLIKENAY